MSKKRAHIDEWSRWHGVLPLLSLSPFSLSPSPPFFSCCPTTQKHTKNGLSFSFLFFSFFLSFFLSICPYLCHAFFRLLTQSLSLSVHRLSSSPAFSRFVRLVSCAMSFMFSLIFFWFTHPWLSFIRFCFLFLLVCVCVCVCKRGWCTVTV